MIPRRTCRDCRGRLAGDMGGVLRGDTSSKGRYRAISAGCAGRQAAFPRPYYLNDRPVGTALAQTW